MLSFEFIGLHTFLVRYWMVVRYLWEVEIRAQWPLDPPHYSLSFTAHLQPSPSIITLCLLPLSP